MEVFCPFVLRSAAYLVVLSRVDLVVLAGVDLRVLTRIDLMVLTRMQLVIGSLGNLGGGRDSQLLNFCWALTLFLPHGFGVQEVAFLAQTVNEPVISHLWGPLLT